MHERLVRIQTHLRESGIDGALIVQKADLFYFSQTVQNGYLFVPADGRPLLMVHKNLTRAAGESCIDAVVGLKSPDEIPGILKTAGLPVPGVMGLELDEFPFLAKGQTQPLQAGMTLALEPKLVIPDKGVVGVENTLVVTEEGLVPLTRFEEDIIVL